MARLSGEARWEPQRNEAASLPPVHGSAEASRPHASGPQSNRMRKCFRGSRRFRGCGPVVGRIHPVFCASWLSGSAISLVVCSAAPPPRLARLAIVRCVSLVTTGQIRHVRNRSRRSGRVPGAYSQCSPAAYRTNAAYRANATRSVLDPHLYQNSVCSPACSAGAPFAQFPCPSLFLCFSPGRQPSCMHPLLACRAVPDARRMPAPAQPPSSSQARPRPVTPCCAPARAPHTSAWHHDIHALASRSEIAHSVTMSPYAIPADPNRPPSCAHRHRTVCATPPEPSRTIRRVSCFIGCLNMSHTLISAFFVLYGPARHNSVRQFSYSHSAPVGIPVLYLGGL